MMMMVVMMMMVADARGLLLLLGLTAVHSFAAGGTFFVSVEDTLSAELGRDLKIPCTTDADLMKLAVQWYIVKPEGRTRVYFKKAEVKFPSDDPLYKGRLSIVDGVSLVVKNVSLVDQREFICSITLGATEAKSTHVNVYANPRLELSPSTEPLIVNNEFQNVAVCVAEDGYPEPKIVWFKNSNPINEDVEVEPEVKKNNQGLFTVSSVLRIRPQKTDMGSLIHCSVTTVDGTTEIETPPATTVTVHYPPEAVSLEVFPNFIKEGDTVTLTCVTDAFPPPTYTFFKGSTRVAAACNNNTCKIPYINRHQGGVYKCEAHYTASPMQTTAKAERQINVHYIERLRIMGIPDGEVNAGDNITMTCSASSSGNMTYHWNKDGERKEDGSVLTRLHVSSYDSGSYTCVAQLAEGSMSVDKTVTITVKGLEMWIIIACGAAAAVVVLIIPLSIVLICKKNKRGEMTVNEDRNDTVPEEIPLTDVENRTEEKNSTADAEIAADVIINT
ncbi:CD166 antigen-like isoform X2 [Lethenteron reissneri]|uniref:CD166 antigen-like isoform X2 n=1 Tax=Lethenteron reissneri TaxID=7753 RepID=UPI002AB74F7F|nr:CD166 antigen-like isoform X2 [Lethenteron reissneri]